MSSTDQSDDEFTSLISTIGSSPPEAMEPTEDASEEWSGKPDEDASTSPSSSADDSTGMDEFVKSPTKEKILESANILGKGTQKDMESLKNLNISDLTLLGSPFVYKLYLATSSENISMLNWSEDGLQLEVDYQEIQKHLIAGSPIFRSRSYKQFAAQLSNEGFQRDFDREMKPDEESEDLKPILLYYWHPQFARGELANLRKLMEDSLLLEKFYPKSTHRDEDEGESPQFGVSLHLPTHAQLSRMRQRSDKCCSIAAAIVRSPLQMARCRLRTLLDNVATNKVLQDSGQLFKKNSLKSSCPWNSPTFASSSIKYVKPHDSVISLDADKPPPAYAGHYGAVSPTKVNRFFADYLPRYGKKTTGYKDIVLETAQKANTFQQNLPIGLGNSDGEDNDPDYFQTPVQCLADLDCMPSTSAAAAAARSSLARKGGDDSVDDEDLEEAMQELCGGSMAPKENASSRGRGKAKAPQPKTPKATARKRSTKYQESSSNEIENIVSQKWMKPQKEAAKDSRKSTKNVPLKPIEDDQEVFPKTGGKSKTPQAKTPKAAARKRVISSSEDEASPTGKKVKSGVQDLRKTQNKSQKDLIGDDIVTMKPEPKKKLSDAEEDDEDTDSETAEEENPLDNALEDEVDYLTEEEHAEEDEYPEENENQEAEADDDTEEDQDDEAVEDEEEDEDVENNQEDDDDDDYNVQYRAAPPDPVKPRRYDLRNSKRKPH